MSTQYTVIIDPVDPVSNDGTMIEHVLKYEHQGGGVFYVAGTDFEQWFVLKPGQAVQVTESEE